MYTDNNLIHFSGQSGKKTYWRGDLNSIAFDNKGIDSKLHNLEQPCYVVSQQGQVGVSNEGGLLVDSTSAIETLCMTAPLLPQQLGASSFLKSHQVNYAYMCGAMAGGIASEELVVALGRNNILSSFGAGGLSLHRIEQAIQKIRLALPDKPYAFNLLHNPKDPALEKATVDLYLKHRIKLVEAAAFINLTAHIVYYRIAGLSLNLEQQIVINNKVIAKLSRREVATQFMQPAPARLVTQLLEIGLITPLQAKLAEHVPMADDITVEADSGGHTDNRPLVCLLPSILALREEIQQRYRYQTPIRIGAAGGIATPSSVLAAFMMGADYVVTGSINQSCVEAGTSEQVKKLLAEIAMSDIAMAPAGDMFELGVKVQVVKRGTLFPMRAQKLYELYQKYDGISALPALEKQKLEQQFFKKTLEQVWQETVTFLTAHAPEQLRQAQNPKIKMALIFRWYLGQSSRWSIQGQKEREMDYQIWCGPAMGAFNDWAKSSYLNEPCHRHVADIAKQLMTGAAFLYRLQLLKLQGYGSLLKSPASYQELYNFGGQNYFDTERL